MALHHALVVVLVGCALSSHSHGVHGSNSDWHSVEWACSDKSTCEHTPARSTFLADVAADCGTRSRRAVLDRLLPAGWRDSLRHALRALPLQRMELPAPATITRSWSTMYIQIELDHTDALLEPPVTIRHTPSPWYLCKVLDGVARYVSRPGAAFDAAATGVEWLHDNLGCGGKHETIDSRDIECRLRVADDGTMRNANLTVCDVHHSLPVWYRPTVFAELNPSVLRSGHPAPTMRLRQCVEVSQEYLVRLVIGMLLLTHARDLATYRPFHYVFMAALSVSLFFVIAAGLVVRSINRGSSFAGLSLGGLGSMAHVIFPTFLVPRVWQTVEWLLWTLPAQILSIEQVGPVPHPGKLAVLCAVLYSAYLTKSGRIFLGDEDEGDDSDSDVDGLALSSWGRRLEAAITWSSVALIVGGTANPEFGCMLALIAAFREDIGYYAWLLYMSMVAQNAKSRARFHGRQLQTVAEFERDADRREHDSATSVALRELAAHVRQNPDVLSKLDLRTASMVREFMHGTPDVQLPSEDDSAIKEHALMSLLRKLVKLCMLLFVIGLVVAVFRPEAFETWMRSLNI